MEEEKKEDDPDEQAILQLGLCFRLLMFRYTYRCSVTVWSV